MTRLGAEPISYLVLGPANLLCGRPLDDDDVIVLVRTQHPDTRPPANTVILRWADLGPLTLTARTIGGHRHAHTTCAGNALFESLLPGHALSDLVGRVAIGTSPPTLLLYVVAEPDHGLRIHSRVDLTPDDACLLHLTTVPALPDPTADLDWLPAALQAHSRQAASLNSHQCHWRKGFPGHELEYKYTLPADTDIWHLAADTHRRIHTGQFPGFVLKYHDGFQTWEYLNYLFDVDAPPSERGYVSYIPTVTTPGWRMKRKWFTEDALDRREQLTDLPPLPGTLGDHVHDTLRLQASQLPTFRRIRYDVNIESLATGHYYGVFYDRCHLIDQPDIAMCQCEIEYCRTRTTRPPNESEITRELQTVATWTENVLADHGRPAPQAFYSKLSFLRRAAGCAREVPS